MKKALLLICIGFLAFISCSKVEESPWENVEISDFFYVDFSDEDELGLKMDSVYVINDNTKIQQIANNLSFLNERLQNFDSNNGTVLITASKQDYNQFKYDAKIMLEWYNGYDTTDSLGNRVHINGTIQKLAGEAQRLKESSNLGERFSNRTFGNFEVRRDKAAYSSCVAYANRENLFSDNRNSLLIFGGYGTGKTHLAAAISNELIGRGSTVHLRNDCVIIMQ